MPPSRPASPRSWAARPCSAQRDGRKRGYRSHVRPCLAGRAQTRRSDLPGQEAAPRATRASAAGVSAGAAWRARSRPAPFAPADSGNTTSSTEAIMSSVALPAAIISSTAAQASIALSAPCVCFSRAPRSWYQRAAEEVVLAVLVLVLPAVGVELGDLARLRRARRARGHRSPGSCGRGRRPRAGGSSTSEPLPHPNSSLIVQLAPCSGKRSLDLGARPSSCVDGGDDPRGDLHEEARPVEHVLPLSSPAPRRPRSPSRGRTAGRRSGCERSWC